MAEMPAEVVPDLEELRPLLYSRGLTVALPRNGLPVPGGYVYGGDGEDIWAGAYEDPRLNEEETS